MTQRVWVYGAGGQGRETAALLRAAAGCASHLSLTFLDDDASRHGTSGDGTPILGVDRLSGLPVEEIALAMGVGYPEIKWRVVRRVSEFGWRRWESASHPSAVLGPGLTAGAGTLIQAGVVVTTDVTLGAHVLLNVGCSVSHDVRVSDYVTVSPGARIGGGVRIGEGAFIGIGASILQGVTVGAWSVIGAGAVVTRDVPSNVVVAGVPARTLRERAEGWHHA